MFPCQRAYIPKVPCTLYISILQIFSPLDMDSLKSKLSSKAKTNKHRPPNPTAPTETSSKSPP